MKRGKMVADADNIMNPQHFMRDPADVWIWTNLDWNFGSFLVEILALAVVCTL